MARRQYYKLRYRNTNSDDEWIETKRMLTWECFNLEVLAHDTEYEIQIQRYHSPGRGWNNDWSPSFFIKTPKRFLTDGYLGDCGS